MFTLWNLCNLWFSFCNRVLTSGSDKMSEHITLWTWVKLEDWIHELFSPFTGLSQEVPRPLEKMLHMSHRETVLLSTSVDTFALLSNKFGSTLHSNPASLGMFLLLTLIILFLFQLQTWLTSQPHRPYPPAMSINPVVSHYYYLSFV